MQNRLLRDVITFLVRNRHRRTWKKIVSALGCIVVFCTTYALILPAITMEETAICGKEEHIHTEKCYTQVATGNKSEPVCALDRLGLHQHTEDCLDENGAYGCGYADFVVHQHDSTCYDETGNLWCSLPEIEAHTHSESCYAVVETQPPHIHTDECYMVERGELICQEAERDGHTHTAESGCYSESGELICQQEQSAGHHHTDDCYAQNKTLICTLSTEPALENVLICDKEERILHIHDSACFADGSKLICDQEELVPHEHGSTCYAEDGSLICEKEEIILHTHDSTCYAEDGSLICGKEEFILHEHDSSCYAEDGSLICGREEVILHAHDSTCYSEDSSLICTQTQLLEHVHSEECFQPTQTHALTCTIPEGEGSHTHSEDCYDEAGQLVCQLEENTGHQHSPLCYGTWELTCQLEEHTHTEVCYPQDTPPIQVQLYTDGSYSEPLDDETTILLSGQLPEGAEAKAYPVPVEIEGKQVLCAYDITVFDANGLIYEPDEGEPLLVSITSDLLTLEEQTPEVYYVPEDGEAEPVDETFEDDSVTFAAPHFSVYAVASPRASVVQEGNLPSGRSYWLNKQRNAFTRDSTYAKYFNENNPLGVAGNFHLVAFDTLELRAHTNGNVLAKNLKANSNFGTNNYPNEISYVQNYLQVNSTSASMNDHILVLGSGNQVGYADNGNALSVKGQKLDKPYHVRQDEDTETAPFIDLVQVKAETLSISAQLAQIENHNTHVSLTDQNNRSISLTNPNSIGVCTLTTKQLAEIQNNPLKITGFESGKQGTVIINVDCTGAKEINFPQSACIYIDGQEQSTNETTIFTSGKVIWNFRNADGVKINTQRMTGIVLAPGATVEIKQNLNGTVVADNITVSAESHRTDFTGKILKSPPRVKDAYVILQKVDQENIGVPLPKAEFDLYVWDSSKNDYSFYQHYACDPNGQAILEDLRYNTAYRLVETTAPDGYILGNQPYDFCFDHDDTSRYPLCQPPGFVGTSIENGDIRYIRNEKQRPPELTSITVQKLWRSESGVPLEPDEIKIQFELWRRSAAGEEMLGTYTLTAAEQWKLIISDLVKNEVDTYGKTVSYVYYIKEIPVENYITTYDNNDGIAEGTIRMTNTLHRVITYELPETGGAGTLSYTAGGLLLMTASIILLYNNKKYGKEDRVS